MIVIVELMREMRSKVLIRSGERLLGMAECIYCVFTVRRWDTGLGRRS